MSQSSASRLCAPKRRVLRASSRNFWRQRVRSQRLRECSDVARPSAERPETSVRPSMTKSSSRSRHKRVGRPQSKSSTKNKKQSLHDKQNSIRRVEIQIKRKQEELERLKNEEKALQLGTARGSSRTKFVTCLGNRSFCKINSLNGVPLCRMVRPFYRTVDSPPAWVLTYVYTMWISG